MQCNSCWNVSSEATYKLWQILRDLRISTTGGGIEAEEAQVKKKWEANMANFFERAAANKEKKKARAQLAQNIIRGASLDMIRAINNAFMILGRPLMSFSTAPLQVPRTLAMCGDQGPTNIAMYWFLVNAMKLMKHSCYLHII